jgi:hypothetical protein
MQTVNTGSLKWATALVLSYLYMVMSWGCAPDLQLHPTLPDT